MPTGFTKVQNEPFDPNSLIDRSFPSTTISPNQNDTTETTVDDNDHSIGTPFIIAVWILSGNLIFSTVSKMLCGFMRDR